MNSVSIRNYGETLAVIKELKKLGFLKSSKPKQKRIVQDLKQDSDLVSYTTPLQNIPIFRPITDEMSQSQIEDVNRRQASAFATLRDEVTQQRLEDVNFQQGQRFDDIQRLGTIFNKFRSQTPEKPYDPLANLDPILLSEGIPDINENTFEGGINEGAPDITTTLPTEVFAGPDESSIPEPRLQPRKPVGKKPVFATKRTAIVEKYELPPVPKQKGSSRSDLLDYYKLLANTLDSPINENIQSKEGLFNEIYRLIDEESQSI
jgi:hypothetical protein